MSETMLSLMPVLGPAFVAVLAALSCAGLPFPGSVALIAGGAFAASGEIGLGPLVAWALAGAIAGDQAGFWIGRALRRPVERLVGRSPARAAQRARALAWLERRGQLAVFLSRWLIAPLGPLVNVASGAGAMAWRRFTPAQVGGEIIWVGAYVGLGYGFSGPVAMAVQVAGDGLLFALAATAAAALGYRLAARLKHPQQRPG